MSGSAATEESRWRGWLVPGALLLVAGIALVVTIVPRPGPGPSPFPTTGPTPAPSLDEHVVLTDQGAVSFHFEDGAIVIRLTEGGATTELGRASVATEVPSPGASPVPAGTALFAMLCGPAEAPDAQGTSSAMSAAELPSSIPGLPRSDRARSTGCSSSPSSQARLPALPPSR